MFINQTEIIGTLIGNATTTTTGSMFLTLLLVMIILMVIALIFSIPLEYTGVLLLPYIIACMAYYSEFVATGLFLILYLGFYITKNFIIK
jgi:hypothetical protein